MGFKPANFGWAFLKMRSANLQVSVEGLLTILVSQICGPYNSVWPMCDQSLFQHTQLKHKSLCPLFVVGHRSCIPISLFLSSRPLVSLSVSSIWLSWEAFVLLSLLRRNSSSSMSDSSTRHLFISELSCLKNTHSLILLSFPQCFYHGPKAVWTKLTLKMTENQAMQILVVKFWLLHVQSICEGLSLSENNSQLAVYI